VWGCGLKGLSHVDPCLIFPLEQPQCDGGDGGGDGGCGGGRRCLIYALTVYLS